MYHELHIACTRGFSTGCRYLFAEVCGGYDSLGKSDAVVLQVDTLQAAANDWVVVHSPCNVVKQLNDQLCSVITWSRLHTFKQTSF